MNLNGWNQFAWQGISFIKPKDWDLGAVEGEEGNGYLRLDDSISCRLELRWQKEIRSVVLEKVMAQYIRHLKRETRTRKTDFRILDKRNYSINTLQGIYFICEGDLRTLNLIAQCKKGFRIILARVVGKREENTEETAREIFNSFQVHTGDNKMLWSVFDFNFTTPVELKLKKHTFLTGHLKFDFCQGKNSFILERLSVADIILKEKSFSQWVREFCESQFKSIDIEKICPRKVGSEEGAYATGRECGKFRFLKRRFFKGLFWRCQKTNHIFGVAELVRKAERTHLDGLISGVKCH